MFSIALYVHQNLPEKSYQICFQDTLTFAETGNFYGVDFNVISNSNQLNQPDIFLILIMMTFVFLILFFKPLLAKLRVEKVRKLRLTMF